MPENKNKNLLLGLFLIVLFGLAMLTACAKIEVIPPKPRPDAPQSHSLPVDYDRLWARAIGWFDAYEAEIIDIDERGGVILGKLVLDGERDWLDCGTFKINAALSQPQVTKTATVRVQVRGAFSTHPQVLVVVTGVYKLDLIDNYAAQTIRKTGPCVLRGSMEREIFRFLVG